MTSIESTCCVILTIYTFYLLVKYLYNEPYKTKDKLTIANYFLFVSSVICKRPEIIDFIGRGVLCIMFLETNQLGQAKVAFKVAQLFGDLSSLFFCEGCIIQIFQL